MKKKVKIKPRLVVGIIAVIIIISIIVVSTYMIRNKKLPQNQETVAMLETASIENSTKQLKNEVDTSKWDLNKVWIYEDPDGVKVPVPIGFTTSDVESEKYVNHNVEMKGILSELTFVPSEKTWEHDESDTDKAWKLNEDNIWVSQNYHVANSTAVLKSNEFSIEENGGYLSIEIALSADYYDHNADILSIILINMEDGSLKKLKEMITYSSGVQYSDLLYNRYTTEIQKGIYEISIEYKKDDQRDGALDRAYIKSGEIINYNNEGIDYAIVHKYGGLVIYEGTNEVNELNSWNESITRNQFVWIPVSDINKIREIDQITGRMKSIIYQYDYAVAGKKIQKTNTNKDTRLEPGIIRSENMSHYIRDYALQGYTREYYFKELQTEFNKTMESIERYGGFYIGRYETGNVSKVLPVVKRLNTDICNVDWKTIYSKTKNISNNNNISVNMIWGCLWNATAEWLVNSGEKTQYDLTGSKDWGNNKWNTFEYINRDGYTETKQRNIEKIIPTGGAEECKANNIYDLNGNVSEFVMTGYAYNNER